MPSMPFTIIQAAIFHEFSLLLAFPHQLDKPVVVARHHGREFMLAFARKRIELVQKQSEWYLILDNVINLRADGTFEPFDGIACGIDLLLDVRVAVFDPASRS